MLITEKIIHAKGIDDAINIVELGLGAFVQNLTKDQYKMSANNAKSALSFIRGYIEAKKP